MLALHDIQAAQTRIANYIRHTPLIEARPVKQPICQAQALYLKLECLQICGSFKPRGAVNKLLSLSPEQLQHGLVTASGGNHGLGVAYAGWLAHVPVTIYLPQGTPLVKAQKLESWGARVIFEGTVWDEANRAALHAAEQEGMNYIHPFADPAVIAGQGTLGLEILADAPDLDLLLVAIGGGGLISGISLAARSLKPGIKVIGVEPVGAPTLHDSLRAGHIVELPQITTTAGTLAPRRSAAINLEIIQQHVDDIVLVTDEEMREAARWLWFEMGIAAELSGAAAVAALLAGKVSPAPSEKVCALVCGAGDDGML
ncbi:MAG: threonine/serine dehydratase [Ktedonobacteraceae bacterium]|nr:threonine/serine dehydratase [Ktedonobacteraceae bacterium]